MGIEDLYCICCEQHKSPILMETAHTCKECAEKLEGKELYTEDVG